MRSGRLSASPTILATARRSDVLPLARELQSQRGELALSGIGPPTLGSGDFCELRDGGLKSSGSLMLTRSNDREIVEFSFEKRLPVVLLLRLLRAAHDGAMLGRLGPARATSSSRRHGAEPQQGCRDWLRQVRVDPRQSRRPRFSDPHREPVVRGETASRPSSPPFADGSGEADPMRRLSSPLRSVCSPLNANAPARL